MSGSRDRELEVLADDEVNEMSALARPVLSTLPLILVVTRYGRLAQPVMEYVINVADRMGCKLLVAYINTRPLLWENPDQRAEYDMAVEKNFQELAARAATKSVSVMHVRETGKVSKAIKRICRTVRRINFVVIDKGIRMEEVSSGAPVPVFNVLYVSPSGDEEQYRPHAGEGGRIDGLLTGRAVTTNAVFKALGSLVLIILIPPLLFTGGRYFTATVPGVGYPVMLALSVFALGGLVFFLCVNVLTIWRSRPSTEIHKMFPRNNR